ncbi:hypothetical protein [Brevundimonas sp.]|uniref:hypothetical protein n=1 Tax=Brevundimonas sp. TaxID=1871086 RepID=UPI0028ABBFF5|nr:hypothetical protein [Brevundimonas sp.]
MAALPLTNPEFAAQFGALLDLSAPDQAALAALLDRWAQGGAGVAVAAGRSANTNVALNDFLRQAIEWYAGAVDGGPEGDGRYPLTDSVGNTYLVPSPAVVAEGGPDIVAAVGTAEAAAALASAAQVAAEAAAANANAKATAAQGVVDSAATVIAAKDQAVAAAATTTDLDALRSTQTIGRAATPITGSNLGANTYYLAQPITRASRVRTIRVFNPGPAGSIRLLVGARSGSTISEVSDTVVPIASGLNVLTSGQFPAITALAGQYVGIYGQSTSARIAVTAGAATDHPGYYSAAGDVNSVAVGSPVTANRIEIGIDWEAVTVTEVRVAGIEGAVSATQAAASKALLALAEPSEVRMGRAGTPVTGSTGADRPFVFGDSFNGPTAALEVGVFMLAAGNLRVGAWSRNGDVLTEERSVTLALPAGLNIIPAASLSGLYFEPGEHLGYYAGTAVAVSGSASDNGGYFTPSTTGNATSFTDSAVSTGVRLEIYVRTVVSEFRDIPARLSELEDVVGSFSSTGGVFALTDGYAMATAARRHVLGYGQSNDIARGASVINGVASVRHLTFNVGVCMTKPGLSDGNLPDDGAKKFLVESVTNPDGGGNCGQTKHWTAALEATRRLARTGVTPTFFRSSAGKGGTGISTIGYGGAWYANLRYHAQRAKALAAADGVAYCVSAVEFDHGETDQANNIAKATYSAAIDALIDGFAADLVTDGVQTARPHWLFTTSPYQIKTGAGPSLAIMDHCALPADGGRPDCHLVLPGYRLIDENGDNTHLTAVSQALKGHYYGRAEAQLEAGRVPDRVWWEGIVAVGTQLTAWLLAPKPIEINTTLCGATTDHGIKVVDATGTLTLSAMAVGMPIAADDVPGWVRTPFTMTLNRSLGANPVFRYALDYANALLGATNGAGGDLFDTTADTCVISGVTHSMAHPAPVCSRPISAID